MSAKEAKGSRTITPISKSSKLITPDSQTQEVLRLQFDPNVQVFYTPLTPGDFLFPFPHPYPSLTSRLDCGFSILLTPPSPSVSGLFQNRLPFRNLV